MDLLTLGFLVIVVALGGVVALAADRLGRKLGKKRLSLFGLRPRHTAEFLTVGAGLLIPLATIGILYTASSDVREWINRGRQAIADLNRTQKELASAKQNLAHTQGLEKKLVADVGALQKENNVLSRRNEALSKDSAAKAREVNALKSTGATLNAELSRKRATVAQQQKLVAQLQPKVARLTAQIDGVQRRLRDTRSQLAEGRRRLAEVNIKRQEAHEKYVKAASDASTVSKRNLDLEHQADELENKIEGLEARLETLQEEANTLTQARDEAQRELSDTRMELSQAEVELEQAQDRLNTAQTNLRVLTAGLEQLLDSSRTRPLVYGFREEVTRIPIPANSGSEAVQARLEALLQLARDKAAAKGAKGGTFREQQYPAAGLFERKVGDRTVKPEEIQRELVKVISEPKRVKEDQVLVAYSSVNTFEGEPVSLEIGIYPNPMVYREGQVVAESDIDGAQDVETIRRELANLLGKKVRERAEKDRMIPRRGGETPFLSVPPEELYSLVQQVRAAARSVRVTAVAEADTRAGDTLKLGFRVR